LISEGYLRRHIHSLGANHEIILLDVAQEYIIEFLRRQGLFDNILVFKGGTALRKFFFGADGRFSTDLDFGFVEDDRTYVDLVFDALDGADFLGVRVRLDNRDTAAASLRIDIDLG
jgi:predicted nucleotidyltransferase component of viral defense system